MHGQSGFSLLEVMVTGVIAVLGLAGLAALVMHSLAQTAGARDQAIAARMADSIAEQLMLEPELWRELDQSLPGETARARHAAWSAQLNAQLASAELWLCRDDTPLDGQPGRPACNGLGGLVVKVFWPDPEAADAWRVAASRLAS